MPEVIRSQILDSNESAFFARELEFIKAKSYDILYPAYMALQLIPISFEAGSGASSITYRSYDRVGMAKISAFYADDLPRSDVKGTEVTAKVRSIVGSYGYSIQEIREALMAGRPLAQMKANAAREANDQLVNQLAWFGDTTHGLQGLVYHPNVTKGHVTHGDWLNVATTNTQIVNDVNNLIGDMMTLTKGVERPDTVLIPTDQYSHIASTRMEAGTDTTILSFLKQVWPGVDFIMVPELAGLPTVPSTGAAAGGSGQDVIIAYKRSADKLELEIPQPYEQFPAQERNLEFIVPVHSRFGGVSIYYPLSVSVGEL